MRPHPQLLTRIDFILDMFYPGFMKLSEGVEWAIHSVVLLAALGPGATLSGAALAEFHGVSESYLLKHLQMMARANILDSIPGPKGGFRLARPHEEITLLDIVEAVEGKDPAFRCTEIRQRGPSGLEPSAYPHLCGIHAAMLHAEAAWKKELRSRTIADLAEHVARAVDPRAVEKAAPWMREHVRS